ncbi:LysR family transcriptional regulator [Streptomyces monticola]|uniref:LysR family transcriptional regulator n=1 Tax=Streptomyces monticola TaxID=2666263 RepID=A0ABW2JTE0_9ACTN
MTSLQQFRTLHFVERFGGIHAAAKALHLSPSAVSQQIKSLSSSCGFELVEPDGRGIRFTENGRSVADVARQITELWERSVSQSRRDGGQPRETRRKVRLGAFPSAMARAVLPAMRGEVLPVDFELYEADPAEGRELVESGDLDAAVSVGEAGDALDARLRAVPLRHDPFALVGPAPLLSSVAAAAAGALSGVPWVLPRAGSDDDRLVSVHFARHGIVPRVVGRTDDWNLAQSMCAALDAVAYVPSSALVLRPDLGRALEAAGIAAPSRTIVLVGRPAVAALPWFGLLQQRLRRVYARTAGPAHTS